MDKRERIGILIAVGLVSFFSLLDGNVVVGLLFFGVTMFLAYKFDKMPLPKENKRRGVENERF